MIKWGRSQLDKAPSKNRYFDGMHRRLVADYFSGENSTCDEKYFERRFRVPRSVLNVLSEAIVGQEPLINHKVCNRHAYIEPVCRFAGELRLFHAGNSCDSANEFIRISEILSNTPLKYSCETINQYFEEEHFDHSPVEK